MKNFKVTVNGNMYEVSVEEVTESGGRQPDRTPLARAWEPPAGTTPPKPQPREQAQAAPANPPADAQKVESPMPGTILDIVVSVGDKVEENAVLVILEAMKMENEIVTPVAGTVSAIHVTKGASVDSGQVLVSVSKN